MQAVLLSLVKKSGFHSLRASVSQTCLFSFKSFSSLLNTSTEGVSASEGLFNKVIYDEETGYPVAQLDVLLKNLSEFHHLGKQDEVHKCIYTYKGVWSNWIVSTYVKFQFTSNL